MRRRIPVLLLVVALAITGCSKSQSPDRGTNTTDDNRSTFALDVDTASYTFAARQINEGNWPEASAVRPEEFVNAFNQRYSQPEGDGFTIHTDGVRLPDRTHLLRVGLQTRSEDSEERLDANLTFVIDTSGSMQEPGRLDLVQDALHYLVDQLRPTDSVAIITFSSRSKIVREMTRISDSDLLHDAIDELTAGGNTNLGAGLVTGYEHARENFRGSATNRVILLSDGLANTGQTDPNTLLQRILDEADKQITLLGVGVGSDYGDELMETLADKGDGMVVYISERKQARDLFVRKLPASLTVRAFDAKAQVVFDSETVASYQLIGYENRELKDSEFRDDEVDGGEIGPGHSVTALYVVRLRNGAEGNIGQVKVRWLDPKTRQPSQASQLVTVDQLQGSLDRAAPGLQVCYAAAFFAEALRRRPAPDLKELANLAEFANEELGDPRVDELVTLIREAAEIR